MNNNLKIILIIILGIIALYVFQLKNSDFNLNKSIEACVVAQKFKSKSFDSDDLKKAKEFCKNEIKKRTEN